MKKGYYLSLEAILSMILLGLLVALPIQESKTSLFDIHIYKKENDLLLLWQENFEGLNETKIRQDFEKTFPEKQGKVLLDGKEIKIGKASIEATASQLTFLDKNLRKHELKLVVFK